jgi:hypothetical protein
LAYLTFARPFDATSVTQQQPAAAAATTTTAHSTSAAGSPTRKSPADDDRPPASAAPAPARPSLVLKVQANELILEEGCFYHIITLASPPARAHGNKLSNY